MGIKEPFKKAFTEKIKKKGLFFSSDAFIALMLFVIVLLGVYSYVVVSSNMQQQYYLSEDLLEVFANVKASDLTDEKQAILQLLPVYNADSTISELIVQNPNEVSEIINGLTYGLVSWQYGVGLFIDGDEVHNDLEGVTSSVSRTILVKGLDESSNFEFKELRLEIGIKRG